MNKIIFAFGTAITLLVPIKSIAGVWCNLAPGWSLTTNGNKGDGVYISGRLEAQSAGIWIVISDGNIGEANVSMALAATMAGKNLSIYLDQASDTCENFPSWAPMGRISHVRIIE